MKPTPEKLDMIIKMAQRCASPLPWEPDNNKANEKIFELWTALRLARAYIDPTRNWSLFGQIDAALDSAQKVEVEK